MSRFLASALLAASLFTAPTVFAAGPDTSPANLPAGSYAVDKTHASITGHVLHMGLSMYTFRFDRFDAGYSYDPKAPTASKVQVTVDTKSMNTGFAKADEEFPVEFLAADKFPKATFTSTRIVDKGNGTGTMTGDLTLGGVTKPVTLDVTYRGTTKGMRGETRAGFSAKTVVKRSEFGLTKYIPMIGDEVALDIEIEFTK